MFYSRVVEKRSVRSSGWWNAGKNNIGHFIKAPYSLVWCPDLVCHQGTSRFRSTLKHLATGRYYTEKSLALESGKSPTKGWGSALNLLGQGQIYFLLSSGRLYFPSISLPWSTELVFWDSSWGLIRFLIYSLGANSWRSKLLISHKEVYQDYF